MYPPSPALSATAVATGFFDGVHRGHQAVVARLLREAQALKLTPCVVTYHPHPRAVLGGGEEVRLLTGFEEKQERLAALGVEQLVVIPFTRQLAALSARDFLERYLIHTLRARVLVAGFDHRLGQSAVASVDDLRRMAKPYKVGVVQVEPCRQGFLKVSATNVRSALCEGNVAEANAMLGYPYALRGRVVRGSGTGRTLGFPTANLQPDCAGKLLPAHGAYAVRVAVQGAMHSGMCSVGTRPTVCAGATPTVEVHLFDFHRDLYGEALSITFARRLREERNMGSLPALRQQLERDALAAKEILG